MVHRLKKEKPKLLTKRQLEKLEEQINEEINNEVKFGVMIEDLEQMSDGTFEFGIFNESGEELSKEELRALDNVLKRNLGKKFTFMQTSLLPLIGKPRYGW